MEDIIYRFEPLWGSWTVDRLLGQGSFGRVWQIRQGSGEEARWAAVKEITVPFSNGDLQSAQREGLDLEGAKRYFEALMEATLEEAALMKRLGSCEHVVRFEELQVQRLEREGEFGWVILIRMERLVPFHTRILEKRPTLRDIVRLGIHISRALEACQQHGIVHRDVKPENLFYDPETDAYKLGDFGIAHYLERPTEGKGRAGTLTHMPPEVFQGAAFTPAADLYALGMILYRLLNDNRIPLLPPYPEPFTPVQRDRATVQRLRGAPVGPPRIVGRASGGGALSSGLGARFDASERGLAVTLGHIAERAICACPERRFPSAGALRRALEALQDGPG